VLDILREVQLADAQRMAASYPHQLSGGQRQRIMIAMALVLDPVLLIADEPTTALDATTQSQILRLMLELQARRGTGLLFITHDFGVVAQVAHRVAVLRAGELVEVGSKSRVLRRPSDPYTRMLADAASATVPLAAGRAHAGAEAPILLSVRGLAASYGRGGWFGAKPRIQAAEDVSFDIRRGQTVGIVGESGAGKSTVARCIVRLVDPQAGQLLLARPGASVGHDDLAALTPAALRPLRQRVQIVFQDPYRSLSPRRTVAQALVEGPMNYGLPREAALQRALQLLDLVRLNASAMSRYPHQFSGGERQRLCIARALMMEPELLVADEAVSALDVSVQAQVLDLLADIRDRLQLAMLFITHDLRVAARMCDELLVMHAGRIVEQGSAPSVFASPAHEYTRSLFAAVPASPFVT
jgi:peptide/nickel transport system ATP-binding protein